MFDRDYSEKRDFRRMSVNTSIQFSLKDSTKSFVGESRDISGSGISFVTEKSLNAGDVLNVVIQSEQTKLPPLEMVVSIIRVTPEADNNFLIAAETTD